MPGDDPQLQEMRCRCCGTFMGYRSRIGRFVFWCSEDCAGSPVSKWPESQIRDEVIVEMFLDGMGILEISKSLNDWPYQYIQQILARRGLQEFMHLIQEHVRIWTSPEGEREERVIPERRVRLVRADKVPA